MLVSAWATGAAPLDRGLCLTEADARKCTCWLPWSLNISAKLSCTPGTIGVAQLSVHQAGLTVAYPEFHAGGCLTYAPILIKKFFIGKRSEPTVWS